MPSTAPHEHHTRRILDAFESDHRVSQRSMAKKLGIAVGLTNLLVKRLVRKGWIRVIQIKPNRVGYFLTPAGIAEKSRMSRDYFESLVQFYSQTRERIQQRFSVLSAECADDKAPETQKRIVFYGAGEVAEIGFICLAETDLELVGVVDTARTKRFFHLDVSSPAHIEGRRLRGEPFGRLVVMSFANTDHLRDQVQALPIAERDVFWL